MEITELDRELRRLKMEMERLQGTVRAQGIILRGKDAPGSGIPTWGARPACKDPAQDGGGGGGESGLMRADAQYNVLAANAADLLFKPDWVRAH